MLEYKDRVSKTYDGLVHSYGEDKSLGYGSKGVRGALYAEGGRFKKVGELALRIFLGYEWFNGGLGKLQGILANPAYAGGFGKVFAAWATKNPYSFMADFLKNTAAPNASAVFTTTAITEAAIGPLFLLGLFNRPASIVGMTLNTIFYLAAGYTSPSTAGINLMMIGAQLYTLLASSGRTIGLDALIHNKLSKTHKWLSSVF